MDTDAAIVVFGALAQSTRLQTFRLLAKRGPCGAAVGDIARELAVPLNTMSAHLAVLGRAGLVRSRRQSRSIIYQAEIDRVSELSLFLLEDCCEGRPEVCAPVLSAIVRNLKDGEK